MISILYDYTYYNGLAGTFTSLIDIYLSLLRFGIKSQFVIFLGESESTFHLAKTQFPQIPFVEARKKNDFYRLNVSFDTLVTNSETVYNIFMPVMAKSTIVLDSMCAFRYAENKRFQDRMKMLRNPYILANPWTMESLSFLNTENKMIYYHKFSQERMEFLEKKYKDTVYNRILVRDLNSRKPAFDRFEYDGYLYKRYRTNGTSYYDNIAKLIFEYRYLGKNVFYSCENKTFNDGLTYYLRLFGIDDNISQYIYFDKSDICNILMMKHTDDIMRILAMIEERRC